MSASVPAVAFGLDPLIAEAKERARRRRFTALAVVLVLAAVGAALALRPTGSPAAHVFRTDGISVRLPGGWYLSRRPLIEVTWPVPRFVLSSFPVTFDAYKAHGNPYLPPQTGVLAQIVEEAPPMKSQDWTPRPPRLRFGGLGKMKLFAGDRWDELLFSLHGRHFYAFVWIGRNAPVWQRQQLLSILDRMHVA